MWAGLTHLADVAFPAAATVVLVGESALVLGDCLYAADLTSDASLFADLDPSLDSHLFGILVGFDATNQVVLISAVPRAFLPADPVAGSDPLVLDLPFSGPWLALQAGPT